MKNIILIFQSKLRVSNYRKQPKMQQTDGTRTRTKYMKIGSNKRKKLIIILVTITAVLLLSVKLISMYVNKIEHEKYILSLDNGMYTYI